MRQSAADKEVNKDAEKSTVLKAVAKKRLAKTVQ
jgi:hypothetical protein